ncbi:MAG TPA: 4-hydroxy-tetrahydrodipicolinate reductase [Acidimicrobiales bacterium]|nr:4-hydroxy-tetrahydrodipicolinate reductase [Acidimicrobiales bacterium]
MTLKVGVIGAAGRMGSTVCGAVTAAPDMSLVAGVDVKGEQTSLDALTSSGAEVAVDFTVPSAAVANAEWCAARGIHCVIGTTGLGDEAVARLQAAYPSDGRLGCVVAPNFAIGAVLMMHFAAIAAPWFETAEIIELHHDRKVDAPSGTAMLTAARMASAASSWAPDPTEVEVVPGARGGLAEPGGIRVHSVRMRGMVAHQEVILGTTGQTLTIRHDSMDRESFMPGVLLAVRAVGEAPGRPGVTAGLEPLLGLTPAQPA